MKLCNSCKNESNSLLRNGCKNNGSCTTNGCNKLSVFNWLSDIDSLSKIDNKFIEIRFKNDRKGFYKKPKNLDIHIGDIVIVESVLGYDVGIVSLVGTLVSIQMRKKNNIENDIKKIYRIANNKEIEIWKKFRQKEYITLLQARKIAKSLTLTMKICDVEYQGDGLKATFYYTAEDRIDFRELIKEFASKFKCKIDMRQIGFRQESAKIGGIGSCGRELCCSSWMTNFHSVSTLSARYQQLSINPKKLAGQCGKLKCCLNFELDSYLEAIQDFPSTHITLLTKKGEVNCLKIDVFRKKMWLVYSDKLISWFEFTVNEVKKFIKINKKGIILPALEELQQNNQIKDLGVDIIQKNKLNRFDFKKKIYKKYPSI